MSSPFTHHLLDLFVIFALNLRLVSDFDKSVAISGAHMRMASVPVTVDLSWQECRKPKRTNEENIYRCPDEIPKKREKNVTTIYVDFSLLLFLNHEL